MKQKPIKIVIFGASGLLGQDLAVYFADRKPFTVVPFSHRDVDILSQKNLQRTLASHRPDVVINCAAITNVEHCEAKPFLAYELHTLAPGKILKAIHASCLSKTIFVQLSSAYVFGNNKNKFKEDDQPQPLNVYGASKAAGESIIAAQSKMMGIAYYIIRTSWLYGEYRPTLVDLAIRDVQQKKQFLAIVDQWSVLTWTRDIAVAFEELFIHNSRYPSGIYHFINHSTKSMSKFDIVQEALKILKLPKNTVKKTQITGIFSSSLPRNAYLLNTKFPRFPHWKASLRTYILSRYTL